MQGLCHISMNHIISARREHPNKIEPMRHAGRTHEGGNKSPESTCKFSKCMEIRFFNRSNCEINDATVASIQYTGIFLILSSSFLKGLYPVL